MSDPNGLERQQKTESLFSFALSKTRKCTKQENYIAEEPKQILYCTSTDGNDILKVINAHIQGNMIQLCNEAYNIAIYNSYNVAILQYT